jgi:WD40 repeat protein
MNHHRILGALLLLGAAILACASPFTAQQVDSAATAVAQTLAAVSPPAVLPTPAPTQPPTPSLVPELLPHSLYYLASDQGGKLQVFRLATDGKTVGQITFEPAPVDSFDVSPVDGSVAYGSNNQLFLVDANGAGRRVLVDGGPVDDNNRFTNSVGVPVWSPDGKTIAFSRGGLNFYSLDTGAINQVLDNQIDTSAGFPIVREIYSPNRYSPDGTRLLINIGFNEAGTFGIYKPADNTLVRFNRPDGGITCCEVRWVPDGSGLYAASPTIGMVDSGLAYVDANTGLVSVLLPGSAPDTTYNFAAGPQVGTDGKLYFFFNNLPQIPVGGHTPMYLVRSDTDGVTGRSKLKPDVYDNLNEVLWAPDASLALVAVGPTPDAYAGGILKIVYPDGRADVHLLDFAQDLHWGP